MRREWTVCIRESTSYALVVTDESADGITGGSVQYIIDDTFYSGVFQGDFGSHLALDVRVPYTSAEYPPAPTRTRSPPSPPPKPPPSPGMTAPYYPALAPSETALFIAENGVTASYFVSLAEKPRDFPLVVNITGTKADRLELKFKAPDDDSIDVFTTGLAGFGTADGWSRNWIARRITSENWADAFQVMVRASEDDVVEHIAPDQIYLRWG